MCVDTEKIFEFSGLEEKNLRHRDRQGAGHGAVNSKELPASGPAPGNSDNG